MLEADPYSGTHGFPAATEALGSEPYLPGTDRELLVPGRTRVYYSKIQDLRSKHGSKCISLAKDLGLVLARLPRGSRGQPECLNQVRGNL